MDVSYFLSRFWRRIHWFLLVAVLITGAALVVARALPPTYVSQTRLLVEVAQIDDATVRVTGGAQLQLVRERLLTRANLLEIARRHDVFEDIRTMTPDEIVRGMRGATDLRLASGRGVDVDNMQITFTARTGRIAAAVLNDYLTIVQQEDVERRTVAAGQTLDFYDEEVDRLSALLDQRSQAILDFQNENVDALPDTLNARLDQQSTTQERLLQIERDISALERQRDQTVRLFDATVAGRAAEAALNSGPPTTRAERELEEARGALQVALATFAPTSPRIRVLRSQVRAAEAAVEAERALAAGESISGRDAAEDPLVARNKALLDIQLAELDARRESLEEQRAALQARQVELEDVLSRIPSNQITLAGLEREYANARAQYDNAVERRARAATGERIEALSRGQRIVVIEPPAVPSSPTGPDRMLIAGGGTAFGVAAGLALVVLLELLNKVPKRPQDLTARFGITPLVTIPFVPTPGQTVRRRAAKLGVIAAGLLLGPLALWLVHTQYRPLDLLLRDIARAVGL